MDERELTWSEKWDAAIFRRSIETVRACIGDDGMIHLDRHPNFQQKFTIRDSEENK
jgi:hypothetical protein